MGSSTDLNALEILLDMLQGHQSPGIAVVSLAGRLGTGESHLGDHRQIRRDTTLQMGLTFCSASMSGEPIFEKETAHTSRSHEALDEDYTNFVKCVSAKSSASTVSLVTHHPLSGGAYATTADEASLSS